MTTRTEALAAGLRWLYETEQPDGAALQHHGVTLAVDGNRWFRFLPSGDHREVIVVVNVAEVEWRDVDSWTKAPMNPLELGELAKLASELDTLGAHVVDVWNGHPGITGSLRLARPAHPSLLSAVDRYHAGCPEHPKRGVFCDCDWYAKASALIVQPVLTAGDAQ
jgi:hypothetical protein